MSKPPDKKKCDRHQSASQAPEGVDSCSNCLKVACYNLAIDDYEKYHKEREKNWGLLLRNANDNYERLNRWINEAPIRETLTEEYHRQNSFKTDGKWLEPYAKAIHKMLGEK